MFWNHKKPAPAAYDKTGKIPVIRSSICTGEQVAGFKDVSSGKFDDLMLIRSDADFQSFLRQYEVDGSEIKREW